MKNAHHGLRRNRSFREAKHLTGTLRIARRKTRSLHPRQESGCMLLAFSAILFLLPLARGQDETTPEGPAEPAQEVTNFRLTDHRGLSHELYSRYDATAVVLIFDDNLSSQVEALVPEIRALEAEFRTKGVVFWIINTADTVDRPALVSKAESLGLSLPMLHDWAGYVVDELGAERISEAVIISAESWTVVYQGLVAKGARRNLERPLAAALTELLRGDPITSAVVAADGPLI
ncbi:MAG: redoxin domain-containing protein, partial [Planctomycetes bacterium]|nr:redoxin domain-containing protein [Planctomycetota bacterium]